MKNIKITALLLLLVSVLVFSLASCEVVNKVTDMVTGNNNNQSGQSEQPEPEQPEPEQPEQSEPEQPEHTHSFGEATCLSPATCICGVTDGDPLGHSIVADKGTAPTCTETGLSDGEHCERCDYKVEQTVIEALGHSYKTEVINPTCTENGWTVYACSCGDSYIDDETPALGHEVPDFDRNNIHEAWVLDTNNTGISDCVWEPTYTAICQNGCGTEFHAVGIAKGHIYNVTTNNPTCTEPGATVYTCSACGDSYSEEIAATGHSYVEGVCGCGEKDPDYHAHNYENVVTTEPTCTAVGSAIPTCACGATLDAVELEMIPHVDANLDITCDYEGCTKRILPAADSKISIFTANHMVIISLSNNYYVEGVVTSVEDAKNGKFVITDEAGDTILIYLPVDENGTTHANWVSKVLVGDVVRVYGKPVNPTGLNTTEKAAIKSGTLTFITKHPHVFGDPTCTEPGYCECGQDGPVALGHVDADGNILCDVCGWNVTHLVENVSTKYNDVKDTDKVDTTVGTALWEGTNFTVLLEKGTGTFNTSGTDHMRYYKNNILTITSTNGLKMIGITFVASSESYVDELEAFLTAISAEYTKDGLKYTVMLSEAAESVTYTNTSAKNCRFSSIEVVYEAPAKAEPVTVVMDNTITDTQTSYFTGGNDAALVGLDASIFNVTAEKGSYNGYPTLYYKSTLAAPSQIRLFNHSSANGNSITVSVADGYEIVSIKITFAITGRANGYIITDANGTEIANVATDATIENVEVSYDVNSSSFTIRNVHTGSSKQIWIDSIEIVYQEA